MRAIPDDWCSAAGWWVGDEDVSGRRRGIETEKKYNIIIVIWKRKKKVKRVTTLLLLFVVRFR